MSHTLSKRSILMGSGLLVAGYLGLMSTVPHANPPILSTSEREIVVLAATLEAHGYSCLKATDLITRVADLRRYYRRSESAEVLDLLVQVGEQSLTRVVHNTVYSSFLDTYDMGVLLLDRCAERDPEVRTYLENNPL